MGVPGPSFSEEERKRLFDPKPLKYFRPPLCSDPRNLIQKVSLLSLENQLNHGSFSGGEDRQRTYESGIDAESTRKCSSGVSSSLNRKGTRSAQTRLSRLKVDEQLTLPLTQASSVNDGNGAHISNEKERPGWGESIVSKDMSVCKPGFVSHQVEELEFFSSTQRLGQNKRLSSSHLKSQDLKFGLELSQKTHRCSTPLSTSGFPFEQNLSRTSNLKSSDWIILDEASLQSGNSFTCTDPQSSDSFTSISPYSEGYLQSDSVTTNGVDNVVCSTPFAPEPEPFFLIPVPEHLRRYSPNMDQIHSPADSSSGVSSLNQTMENVSSCCSLRSTSPESSSPVAILDSGAPSLTEEPDTSDSFKKQPGLSSVDTSLNRSSSFSKEEVLGSWNASFSVSSIDKPRRSRIQSQLVDCPSDAPAKASSSLYDSSKSALSSMGLPTVFGASNALKRKAFQAARADADVDEIVLDCFSKKFTFEPCGWNLPDANYIFSSKPWELPNFLHLKQKLNSVKDELNDLTLQDWHAHTRKRNKAGNVIWQLRQKIDPEFPTQAWCKFYENVSSFPLVPHKAIDRKCLNSVHLCEAPGAFITSLNHYLHVNHGRDFKFDWRAVTLNPYYEGNPLSCMINDDRLVLQTLDKWLFGKDNTGDLMSKDNLLKIMQDASELGEILLITADGSFDCQDNPAEQEDLVSWLHFCECVAAFHMLASGGSLLIKMFTFYEHASICLMYLLNCVFKSVTVNKPVTSKEGNSEVYVVCTEYRGSSFFESHLKVLLENYSPSSPGKALFPLEKIPSDFLEQLFKCADFFCKVQSDVIMENVRSFHNPAKRDSYVTAAVRHRVANTFFTKYGLKKLDRDLYLVDKKTLKVATTLNLDPKGEEGSFNDRKRRMEVSVAEELKYLEDDLRYLNVAWPGDFDVFWLDFPDNPKGFKIVKGKPVTKVNSSKFCLGRLLKIRNRVREIAHSQYEVQVSQGSISSDSREFPWPDEDEPVKRKVTTLDFKNELWSSLEDGNNTVYEKNACRQILSAIENQVFRDDCLELRGYPLLTQFNVGLVYLIGHLFEKVGFVRPVGQDIRVLFYSYQKFHPKMKHHWDEVVSVMEHDSEAVLSVVQVSELSDGDFYKYVTEINNLCVVEQIQDLLTAMSGKA